MPSTSYKRWKTSRIDELKEIEQAHAAVGGTGRGRRYATQQINRAYAVLLASQFQGFCRDLHSESVDYLVATMTPGPMRPIIRADMTRGRRLDRGNAQPDSIKDDFGRLGIDLWKEVLTHDQQCASSRALLEELNRWRNAIAHHDFDPSRLGGTIILRLTQVRKWQGACDRLVRGF